RGWLLILRHTPAPRARPSVTDHPEDVPIGYGRFDEVVHVSLPVSVDLLPENIVVPGEDADDDAIAVFFPELQALTDFRVGGLGNRPVRNDGVRRRGESPVNGDLRRRGDV